MPTHEDRKSLPPKLHIYWESAELKARVENFIMQEQMAGRLPRTTPRGQRYWLSHFIMDAIKARLPVEKPRKR